MGDVGSEAARRCPACGASDWGTRNRCKPCRAARARDAWTENLATNRAQDAARHRTWRASNVDKARAQKRRQLYALGDAAFRALLTSQDGRCAICRASDPICVDHCHRTGKVRGVLCRTCNTGLGHFGDDPRLLVAAFDYLRHANDEV